MKITVFHWKLISDVEGTEGKFPTHDKDAFDSEKRVLKTIEILTPVMSAKNIIVLHDVYDKILHKLLLVVATNGYQIIAFDISNSTGGTIVMYPQGLYRLIDVDSPIVASNINTVYAKPPKLVIPEPGFLSSLFLTLQGIWTGKAQKPRQDLMRATFRAAQQPTVARSAILCKFRYIGNAGKTKAKNVEFVIAAYQFPTSWANNEVLTLHLGTLVKLTKIFANELPMVICVNGNFTPTMKQYTQFNELGFQSVMSCAENSQKEPPYTYWAEPFGNEMKETIDYIFLNSEHEAAVTSTLGSPQKDLSNPSKLLTADYPSSHLWMSVVIGWS